MCLSIAVVLSGSANGGETQRAKHGYHFPSLPPLPCPYTPPSLELPLVDSELGQAVTENFEFEKSINKSCNVTSSAHCTLMFTNLTMTLYIDSKRSNGGESSLFWIECSLTADKVSVYRCVCVCGRRTIWISVVGGVDSLSCCSSSL